MNLDIESAVLGTLTIEMDRRYKNPSICIGDAEGPQYIWIDEKEAVFVRDWLNKCLGKDLTP